MALQVYVQINNGNIRSNTDFLYLQPQIEVKVNDIYANQFLYGGNLGLQRASNINKKAKDSEPFPKRLRDLKKERVILIDKNATLCDNVGTAFVDLSVEKGLYKLYYLRIENDQRVMPNSRLDQLGFSESFSIKKVSQQENFNASLEESKYKFEDSSHSENSNSIDSRILLQQLKQGGFPSASSNTYSVMGSSDQTKLQYQSSRDEFSHTLLSPQSFEYVGKLGSQNSNFQSLQDSITSQNSQTTYVVKKENNEAIIMTQKQGHNTQPLPIKPNQQYQSQPKHHRRNQNFSQVLEEISQSKLKSKKKTKPKTKSARQGKENRIDLANTDQNNSQHYQNSVSQNQRLTTSSTHQKSINDDNQEDDLNVQYVDHVEILKKNPITRAYFKMSIYSPSNRLDTVQEEKEQNSTISEVTVVEQFSSSYLNSGMRPTNSRSKINHHPLKKSSGLNLLDEFKESDMVIEERLNENDDFSESMEVPSNPVPKNKVYKERHFKKENYFNCNQDSTTGTHTRENSNQIYSSKASIIGPKGNFDYNPLGAQARKALEDHQRLIQQSYRQSFNGYIPQESVEDYLKGTKATKNSDTLDEDIHAYMGPYSGTFICTGGTELDKGLMREQGMNTPLKSERSNLSIEKTVIKNASYNHPESPKAYFDEKNMQVFIIQHDFEEQQKVQHCIKWSEDVDPDQIGKAIEQVIQQVQMKSNPSSARKGKV